MYTLTFTREFTKGHLKGDIRTDFIKFPSVAGCERFVRQINSSKTVNYKIVDYKIVGY